MLGGTGLLLSHGSFVDCVEKSHTSLRYSHAERSSTSSFGEAAKLSGGGTALGGDALGTSGRMPSMGLGMLGYFGGSTNVSASGITAVSLEGYSSYSLELLQSLLLFAPIPRLV